MASDTPLTSHLLKTSSAAYNAATKHSFLAHAGHGTLPDGLLVEWLIQDRLYALNYVSFIGNLLAKVQIPTSCDREQTLEWRIVDLLIDALTNIRREIRMFEDILRKDFGWDNEDDRATTQTRAYADLFAGASKGTESLLVGLTTLWATERCYLDAWTFARNASTAETHVGVLHTVLIPNWTSKEFDEFVNRIAELVNELAAKHTQAGHDYQRCEDVWRQVLWAEEAFWPRIE